MLIQQQTIQLTAYAELYDKVVPQKHLLRQINDLIDFSFVYQELVSKYCPDNGRRAESPIRLFKYLLLKVIYDSSDVDVVERSMYDMSFKYFLGMSPEEDVINPSTLTKLPLGRSEHQRHPRQTRRDAARARFGERPIHLRQCHVLDSYDVM